MSLCLFVFCFFVFFFLLIACWTPWALVTEDKLTWEWLSHQSLSLNAIHLRLWAARPKFCPPQNRIKKNKKLSGFGIDSIFCLFRLSDWLYFFQSAWRDWRSSQFPPFKKKTNVLSQVAKDQGCFFFPAIVAQFDALTMSSCCSLVQCQIMYRQGPFLTEKQYNSCNYFFVVSFFLLVYFLDRHSILCYS